MTSPTARTLAHCKKQGWLACVVERYVAQFGGQREQSGEDAHRTFGHRVDVFGFGDVLALDGQPGSLLIQATSGSNVAGRLNKIKTECADNARAWLAAGNRIAVYGWAKKSNGTPGGRKLWSVRVVEVTGAELAPVEFKAPRGKRRRKATQLELGERGGAKEDGPW